MQSATLQALLSSTLSPNSAITNYAVEGTLLISVNLSTKIAPKSHDDNVFHKICEKFECKNCIIKIASKHAHKHWIHPLWVKTNKQTKISFVSFEMNLVGFVPVEAYEWL